MTPTLAPYVQAAGLCVQNQGLPMLTVFIAGVVALILGVLLVPICLNVKPAICESTRTLVLIGAAGIPFIIAGSMIGNGMFFIGTGGFCG